ATEPTASAIATLRLGSRISSATYTAAFQPEYVNMIATSARSHDVGATGAEAACRFAIEPVPNANPSAMKSTSADTLSAASTLPTIRPGPTPRTWIQAIKAITHSATRVCGEMVSGTN